ncbi:MAG: hypothetical protein E7066_09710 [Lentimicrobiaceae bacterium]|nr:hypothetical protein [Lentimicrobiaceae bacterium]
MKILRYFLVLCIMTFAFNVNANAQAASKAGKIVKELVKKGSKSTSKVKPKSNNYKPTTVRPKPRATIIECSTCKGHGKVNVWNQYYGYWQTQTCNRCNGTGRVRSN